jgi:Ca-activated chloride channel homolog
LSGSLGKKLKEKGIDFKAHIVGFGLENGEGAGLQCLADATGGLFVEARTAASLTAALNPALERVSESKAVSAPVRTPVLTPTPEALADAVTLKASAFQTQGGEPINNDVAWVLTMTGESPTVVDRSYEAVWNAAVPPGQYQLHVEHGAAKATLPIKVEAGKVLDPKVVLGSGTVKVSAAMKEGGSFGGERGRVGDWNA